MGKTTPRAKIDFQLGKRWRNATKTLGKKPDHRSSPKNEILNLRRVKNDCAREVKTHIQQFQNRNSHTTNFHPFKREPNVDFWWWGKRPRPKIVNGNYTQQTHEGKAALPVLCMRKNEECGCMAEWHTFLGIFLAKEVRTRFSKMGPLPNSNFYPYSSHSMQ